MRQALTTGLTTICLGTLPGVACASQYTQTYAPLGGSSALSAPKVALPLASLFILLDGLRLPAKWAAVSALAVSILVAFFVYAMPAAQVGSAALERAAIGFFPIIWIAINAIWVDDLTEASGHLVLLRRGFGRISDDLRVQAILMAFCFGALLESFAGGGRPVAICAIVLIALGLDPARAATARHIADTSPVAFGSLGLPSTMLSKVLGPPVPTLSAMAGRQTPVLEMLAPFILTLGPDAAVHKITGRSPPRSGNRVSLTAPRNVYATIDDAWLALLASTQGMADRLFRSLNRPELDAVVQDSVGQHTLKANSAFFRAADLTVGPVYDASEFGKDLHVQARGVLVEVDDAELGSLPMHAACPTLSTTPGVLRSQAPDLGQHEGEVLIDAPAENAEVSPFSLQTLAGNSATADPCKGAQNA